MTAHIELSAEEKGVITSLVFDFQQYTFFIKSCFNFFMLVQIIIFFQSFSIFLITQKIKTFFENNFKHLFRL